MQTRPVSVVTIMIASLSACASPRAALAGGATAVAAGALVMLLPSARDKCTQDLCDYGDGVVRFGLGTVMLTAGAILSLVGLTGHEPPEPGTPRSPPRELPDGTRGFFCIRATSHRALEICVRDAAACDHARQILATPSLAECAPTALASCFDVSGEPRCFATPVACELQRARVPESSSPCAEWR